MLQSSPWFHEKQTSTVRNGNRLAALRELRGMVVLRIARKTSPAHILTISTHGAGNRLANIGVLPRKFRGLSKGQPQQIVDHEDLPVAVRTGSDADGGNAQLARDLRAKF